MFNKALVGIDLIAIDTDIKSLEEINEVKKIQIGSKLLNGLSSEMKPELAKESNMENYDEIKAALADTDIVFILAGLGGGTGSGASPIVAKIAKEIGALTIAIVTMPFKFEGKQRFKLAEFGLENIKKESDSVVVIQNEKHLPFINKNLALKDAFKVIDVVVEEAINGMIGVLLSNEENDINLDFYDLKMIMSHKGMALIGVGKYEGKNSANEAIKQSIGSLFLEDVTLNEATGILIHFTVHTDFPIVEIAEAMEVIYENAHYDVEVIFGVTTDTSLSKKYVKATMILTGFEKNYNVANNVKYEG